MKKVEIDTTHTCHAECPRPACVAARKAVAKSKNPERFVEAEVSKVKPEDHPDFVGGWTWTKLELDWINERIGTLEASLFQAQNAAIGLTAQLEIYESALESIILCREDSLEATKAKQALAQVRGVVL